jgi:hypothetical protein
MRDIYNPPPAAIPLAPPRPDPIRWTTGDLVALAAFAFPVYLAAAWAWSIDITLGLWVTVAGVFMILESWLSALTFLNRHPDARGLVGGRRLMVFFTALSPWLITLAFGVTLMLGLFMLSDSPIFFTRNGRVT